MTSLNKIESLEAALVILGSKSIDVAFRPPAVREILRHASDYLQQQMKAIDVTDVIPSTDTCTVCNVTLPMGDEFDNHCCCGVGCGTNPDCQRCA